MRDYRKFEVWKLSHEFALKLYPVLNQFPREELYGLTSQLKRASLSVPTNIVEGVSRSSEKEFAYFINIAIGSAAETEYLIEFAKELGFFKNDDYKQFQEKIVSIRKMLSALYTTLNRK